MRFLVCLLIWFSFVGTVGARELGTCHQALVNAGFHERVLWKALNGMVLDDSRFEEPQSLQEIETLLRQMLEDVRKALFQSDPIKAMALKRIADEIESLMGELDLPRQRELAEASALNLIDVWQVQKALKRKLPSGYQMDSLPYLFLRPMTKNSIAQGAGLKVRVRGDSHNRVFLKIRVSVDQKNRLRLEILGSEPQNRHGAYESRVAR